MTSVSGNVPVLFMCCEYQFLDLGNFLFLINSNPHHHHGELNLKVDCNCKNTSLFSVVVLSD